MYATCTPTTPYLRAETAAELMRSNPLSLRDDATLSEAVRFLTDRGISAAPVIDDRGRPIGVLSRSDLLVHDREHSRNEPCGPEYYGDPCLALNYPTQPRHRGEIRVRDLMTPVIFSIAPEAPAAKVIESLVRLKVHRLFVVDAAGTLVGVISAVDVLNNLLSEPLPAVGS